MQSIFITLFRPPAIITIIKLKPEGIFFVFIIFKKAWFEFFMFSCPTDQSCRLESWGESYGSCWWVPAPVAVQCRAGSGAAAAARSPRRAPHNVLSSNLYSHRATATQSTATRLANRTDTHRANPPNRSVNTNRRLVPRMFGDLSSPLFQDGSCDLLAARPAGRLPAGRAGWGCSRRPRLAFNPEAAGNYS